MTEQPGLPPDGDARQFIGFDKDGRAFVLRWVHADLDSVRGGPVWTGIGFEKNEYGLVGPVAFWGDGAKERIVSHMPIEGRP